MIQFLHKLLENLTRVKCNELMVKYLLLGLQIVGLDVNLLDMKFNWRSFLVVLITHSVIISFIFVILSSVSISDKLEAFSILIVILQGTHKFWSTFICSDYFYTMLQQLHDLHTKYEAHPVIGKELKKICLYYLVIGATLAVSYGSVAVAYYLYPLYMWKRHQVQVIIIPIPLPGFDWRLPIGYTINVIHQVWLVSIGLIGLVSADITFLYQVLHTIGYLKIFKYRVTKLEKHLEDGPRDMYKMQKHLYESIAAHQDYIAYINTIDGNYSQICLGQLVTIQLELILALFLTLWYGWIIGPSMCVAAVFQLLEYCILGTVVTQQNEKASEIIYGMKWYLLPVHLQRLIVLMIARGQIPAELTVGHFAILNVETAMNVLKGSYSYLMMLMEFMK